MPGWDGSGNFTLNYTWVNDAANGIPITASRMDTQENTIATNGFGNCVTRDGQGKASANQLPDADNSYTLGSTSYRWSAGYFLLLQTNTLSPSTANGPINLTAGQIQFPAVQNPSSNANTLDDYEEGAFVPTVIGSGGSNSHTYGITIGQYTKIGRVVIIQVRVTVTAFDAWSGNVSIGGLPFASAALASAYGGFGISEFAHVTLAANYTQLGLIVVPGTTTLSFQQSANNNGAVANVATTAIANGFDISFSGSYIV